MREFLDQPWWLILLSFLMAIGSALFIGKVHILWDGPFQIWVEKPITAILVGLGILASICNL